MTSCNVVRVVVCVAEGEGKNLRRGKTYGKTVCLLKFNYKKLRTIYNIPMLMDHDKLQGYHNHQR